MKNGTAVLVERIQKLSKMDPPPPPPQVVAGKANELKQSSGPLSVYTPSGKLITSTKATLFKCLQEMSRLVGMITITMELLWNKADATAFKDAYTNRNLSDSNVQRLRRRMNARDWYVGPNLGIDSNGNPCDGGHAIEAFIGSDLATIKFIVQLGLDPRMNTRRDTGVSRTLIDQAHYLDSSVLDDIELIKEQRTFTSSVALVFGMIAEAKLWNIGLGFQDAKKEVLQHRLGVALIENCLPHFMAVRDLITKLEKSEETDFPLFRKQAFFVPAIILRLSGYNDYPERMILGDDARSAPLTKGNRWFTNTFNETQNAFIEGGTRHEQGITRNAIDTLLTYAHAEASGIERIKTPLPLYKQTGDGDWKDMWPKYTREQKSEDAALIREVSQFFLSKIKQPKLTS